MSLGICCDSRSYNLGLPVCLGVSLTCLTPVPWTAVPSPEVTWVWLGSKGFSPVPAVRSPEPSTSLPSIPTLSPRAWPLSQQNLVRIHGLQNSKTIVVSLLTFFFSECNDCFFLLLRKINIF